MKHLGNHYRSRSIHTAGSNCSGFPMVNLNVANFITIGLIAVVATVATRWALGAVGVDTSWL